METHQTRESGGSRMVKALVVNSDPRRVQECARALRHEGYVVFEATAFAEGRRLWLTERPQILVVDIVLGDFNGLQLAMRARDDQPDVRVVITCPFSDAVLEAETRRLGATFLAGPVDPAQVLASIGRVAARWDDHRTPRRLGDRRQVIIPGFAPERRVADRRRTH